MNQTLKRHLISAGVTFVATFALVFFGAMASSSFEFSRQAIVALSLSAVTAATRAVAKIIYEYSLNLLKK